ncbi:MAG: LAGLIDADG family homing endonuclease [Candidatus Diapherotrites archaeon]|nr:LAGLIDADG family homing endonuclease [Candidatus Diapherotrites archaeon]
MDNSYLNIGKEEQHKLLQTIKQNIGMTWTQISEFLEVNRSTVLFYNSGTIKIPQNNLLKLIQKANITVNLNKLKFVTLKFRTHEVSLPAMSEQLAEFLGIVYGDGCLTTENYGIIISEGIVSDKIYIESHVKQLMKNLFQAEPWFRYQRNVVHCNLSSKKAHQYLAFEFSIPVGYKKGRMHIPKQVYEQAEYKKAFLRGLFDTDGGFHRHHTHSAQIEITSHDPVFLKEVWNMFLDLGFNAKIGKEQIWILDRNEIDKFFQKIKPNNPKHLYKYQVYKETGIVPRHKDIHYAEINFEKYLQEPGIGPGLRPWQGRFMPLEHTCISQKATIAKTAI